jgi:8-hydroxy-5-deazaflavin:NADPH oxidoreductase
MKIAMIGDGNVGSALARGLERAGHEVLTTGNDPARIKELAAAGEVVVLAVPYRAHDELAEGIRDLVAGKPVVDVSNALTREMTLVFGHTTSAAEELQNKLPGANVVKAFNTVFAHTMDSGKVDGQQVCALVAGDDDGARSLVIGLARDIGYDAVDAGPLAAARLLEPLGLLNIQLGAGSLGRRIGFKLVH